MATIKKPDRVQFLARFAYVGSSFHGVQEQPRLPTVLGALRQRIERASQQKARALYISARTDRGVHALENFATWYLYPPLVTLDFMRAVSAQENDGLLSVFLTKVPPFVHARGSSTGKTYCYHIMDSCQETEDLNHPYIWKIVPRLCLKCMNSAASFLVGEMDFSSLRGGGCQAKNPVKKIHHITLERTTRGLISIEVYGSGFLRKMIRNLVGLLVEIGAHLRAPCSIPQIMGEGRRSASGITAPAHGLFLTKVHLNY